MGLPINKLFLCTNKNNTLHRFFSRGEYHRSREVHKTLSPSMDIQVASNFERYLYFLADENHALLREWMHTFEKEGKLTLSTSYLTKANKHILSCEVNENDTIQTISQLHKLSNYTVCPHTAVGISGGKQITKEKNLPEPLICLATAHPAKFVDAVTLGIGKNNLIIPEELSRLFSMPTKVEVIDRQTQIIKEYIIKTLTNKKQSKL